MATAARIEPADDDIVITGAMVLAEPKQGTVVLLDRTKFEPFFENVATEARAQVFDMSTARGREACKSYVFQNIVKIRTGLESQANDLTEEWRKNTKAVTSARNEITDRFKALAAEIRKPLDEWEEAEKTRVAECEAIIARLQDAAKILLDDTSEAVLIRGGQVKNTVIDPDRFGSLFEVASAAKRKAWEDLKDGYERLTREEADRAELARLQAAERERHQREADEAAAREAAAAEGRAAREAQERADRLAREAYEREEQIARDAERRARDEADRIAREAAEARQREHEEALAAERRAREAAEAEAQAERDRAAEAERQRERAAAEAQAERDRLAAIEAERVANHQHRIRVRTAIEQAFMARGADDASAHKIVSAIIGGEIANIEVKF